VEHNKDSRDADLYRGMKLNEVKTSIAWEILRQAFQQATSGGSY